jgi:hypothetical protein
VGKGQSKMGGNTVIQGKGGGRKEKEECKDIRHYSSCKGKQGKDKVECKG